MAANQIQQILVKRGNTASISSYTGPLGELVLNTQTNQLVAQDGVTPGWRLYMNSQSVVTNASTATFSPTPAIVELGGYQGAGNYLNGQMSAAMVYNRVLSDLEIVQNYNYFKSRFSISA